VLCHSLADALLGAACMGGISDFYPDKNNFDSYQNLGEIEKIYYFEKMKIVNLDITIQSKTGFFNDFRDKLKQQIQNALFLKPGQINIKINDFTDGDDKNFTAVSTVALVRTK
jgi:2-C-methyl-D-erythritol 4-phosphate cytidylyltransferase/2-C-methyl-D-erythritol 2,4-cyclodiphosphate synthase